MIIKETKNISLLRKTICVLLTLSMLLLAVIPMMSFANVPAKQYSMGPEGLALLKKREGFRSTKYWDVNAYRIGYGTTWTSSIPDPITEPEAAALLVQVLAANYEPYLDRFLYHNNIQVSQNQYDALLDITYNVGPGMWSKYIDSDLAQYLIKGNYTAAQITDAFCQFNKAGGKYSPGTVERRKLEAALFVSGMKTYSIYNDVADQAWYFNAVKWAKNSGVMSGTTATTFDPTSPLTRAMAASTIARMCGANLSNYTSQVFGDVPSNKWYATAVNWAQSVGIVSGVGYGNFWPNEQVSRQDFVLMLYNYGRKFQGVSNWDGKLTIVGFTDASSVSSYAYTAVAWATRKGIMAGKSDNTLDPKSNITRAQAASILKSFYDYCS